MCAYAKRSVLSFDTNNFYSNLICKIGTATMRNMPDESCRNCGGKLTKCTVCAECRMPVSMICLECGKRTGEQVHALCFMTNIPKIEEPNATPSGIFARQILVA